MPDPAALLLAALLGAEVAAVGLAVRRRVDRALVALLAFALVDEVLQLLLHAWLDTAPRPLAGWHRAGWQASIALSLGWPAVLAWAAQKTSGPVAAMASEPPSSAGGVPAPLSHARWESGFLADRDHLGPSRRVPTSPVAGGRDRSDGQGKWRGAPVNGSSRTHPLDLLLGSYVGLLAGLAIVYPPSRAGLRWTLLVWELACVAMAWWGIARRWGRTWGAVEHVLVVLVSCETMVCVVGPFASDPFTRWWIARAFYLGAWGAACGVLARGTITRSSSPRIASKA